MSLINYSVVVELLWHFCSKTTRICLLLQVLPSDDNVQML